MSSRILRVTSWAALFAAGAMAVWAVFTAGVGIAVLTGQSAYPFELKAGPIHVQQTISTPVRLWEEICQSQDVESEGVGKSCRPLFILEESWTGTPTGTYTQDADIRPTEATLDGAATLAFDGGWNGYVATSIAFKFVAIGAISVLLFALAKLLRNASSGRVFVHANVRWISAIAWLLLGWSLLGVAKSTALSLGSWGYWTVTFGPGGSMSATASDAFSWPPLAAAVLVLVLAEVFRHGMRAENENRLTV